MPARCHWANSDPLYVEYHDKEWGVPEHDDVRLFEFLTLEGAQAGLSWLTILRKRRNYRLAFDGFHPDRIASYDDAKVKELLSNEGIVRNRLKIRAAIGNARAFISVVEEFGSFDRYVWSFVGGAPKVNAWRAITEVPSKSVESESLSRELAGRGFRFVGPTICYAFMQAAGLVNDHVTDCFRYRELL